MRLISLAQASSEFFAAGAGPPLGRSRRTHTTGCDWRDRSERDHAGLLATIDAAAIKGPILLVARPQDA